VPWVAAVRADENVMGKLGHRAGSRRSGVGG
jgi:hypothetical protein